MASNQRVLSQRIGPVTNQWRVLTVQRNDVTMVKVDRQRNVLNSFHTYDANEMKKATNGAC